MNPSYHYWTFDLNRYVFEVKDINFTWVTTWWGITLLILFFGGSFYYTKNKMSQIKTKISENPEKSIKETLHKKYGYLESFQTFLIYLFGIFSVLFTLQKFNIQWGLLWYSTMYLAAFTVVYIGFSYWMKKEKLMMTESLLMTFITMVIIGMLVGARLTYVIVYSKNPDRFNPLEIIATWEGGLSFHGAVIGICLAILLFCKKYKIPFFHITDKACLIVPIGIGLGRIGNLMNGELWGRPIESHVPWAVIFPAAGMEPRHPSQIYQSLGEGWGLLLTMFIISRFKQREGTLSACFIIFYSIYRFVIEYFRAADAQLNYFNPQTFTWGPISIFPQTPWWQILTMGQILCLVSLFAGIILLFLIRKNIYENSPEWIERNKIFFKKHLNRT